MAYLCEKLITDGVNQFGTECVVYSGFLPPLSTADKDNLLLWMIGIFLVVFTLKQLRKLFGA